MFDSDLSAKQEKKVEQKAKKSREAKTSDKLSGSLLRFLDLLRPEVERSRQVAAKFKVRLLGLGFRVLGFSLGLSLGLS